MKNKRTIYFIILVLTMLFLPLQVHAASIRINTTNAIVYVNDTKSLKILGTNKKAKGKSSNTKIATVNSEGIVTGKAEGKVTITATLSGQKLKCIITVKYVLPAPKLGKFIKTNDFSQNHQIGSGVQYTVKWNTVKGASGYQVKEYEKGWEGGQWWSQSSFTTKEYYSVSFSDLYAFKVRVRAFKYINGKKIYGQWSSPTGKVIYYG